MANKPGPKPRFTQDQLSSAIDLLLQSDPGSEIKHSTVLPYLRQVIEDEGYKPRDGDLNRHIESALAARDRASEEQLIAALPQEVVAANKAAMERASYGNLLVLAKAYEVSRSHALVPLREVQNQNTRLEAAFDKEREARLLAEERAQKAEEEVGRLQQEKEESDQRTATAEAKLAKADATIAALERNILTPEMLQQMLTQTAQPKVEIG